MSTIGGRPVEKWIEDSHPRDGIFRAYYKKDKGGISLKDKGYGLRYEWYYKDGSRADGISKGWHRNGQLKSKETYKDGKKEGKWISWYPNGQKEWERMMKSGERDGLVTEWYENGEKRSEGTYKDGKEYGLFFKWHENRKVKSQITYHEGYRIGEWSEWYSNGNKSFERICKDEIKLCIFYSPDGKESSEARFFTYPKIINNKLIEIPHYLDGVEIRWHENGQKRLVKSWKNGEKDGKWTKWHENGTVGQEILYKYFFVEISRHEKYKKKKMKRKTKWYDNGQKMLEENYNIKGKLDKKSTYWYKNGRLGFEGDFCDGREIGKHIWYYENGEVENEINYN
jgi:antitoxin component YwqK of YwqJK toxin-antitoxin module